MADNTGQGTDINGEGRDKLAQWCGMVYVEKLRDDSAIVCGLFLQEIKLKDTKLFALWTHVLAICRARPRARILCERVYSKKFRQDSWTFSIFCAVYNGSKFLLLLCVLAANLVFNNVDFCRNPIILSKTFWIEI
jgi:hypothetical protein